MHFSRVLTLVAGAAWLAACSGGNNTGPSNTPPTADYTVACTDLACTFTDGSSDVDGSIKSVAWDFGDPTSGANTSTAKVANHTFSSANTYSVKLTATDNDGAINSKTASVTVTAGSPGGPTAGFDVTCGGPSCTVTNTSTATGAATWAWDFGDGLQTSTAQDPGTVTYSVAAPTTYTITLVVTDGGLTSQASRQVRVQPGATLTCNGSDCTLGITQKATVLVTLESSSCETHGNTFVITQPAVDTLFTDGCFAPVAPAAGSSFPLNNGAAYDAGTQLAAEVLTGVAGATSAQLEVTGDFASGWTLKFDDGFVGPGEPDFNDLIILVKATPAP
jgi:PKD repeat protein